MNHPPCATSNEGRRSRLPRFRPGPSPAPASHAGQRHPWNLARLAVAAGVVALLASCATSRPDLVWTEDHRQRGKASWYDDHGERTANGEIYNMYAMTAAHPSLALNSVVEVANLGNGRRVMVRINDRLPPIHEGRVIDLSKAAFNALDSLSAGLIDVELRVVQYGNNKYLKINRAAPTGKMHLTKPKSAVISSKTSQSARAL